MRSAWGSQTRAHCVAGAVVGCKNFMGCGIRTRSFAHVCLPVGPNNEQTHRTGTGRVAIRKRTATETFETCGQRNSDSQPSGLLVWDQLRYLLRSSPAQAEALRHTPLMTEYPHAKPWRAAQVTADALVVFNLSAAGCCARVAPRACMHVFASAATARSRALPHVCAGPLPLKTVWPSGLRRWLQAPVRKGVGLNPTAVTL